MATRIVILDAIGRAVFSLDGHNGQQHAAEWTARTLEWCAQHGISATALEIVPAEGGDAYIKGVHTRLHLLRAEFHSRPDGRRELLSLNLFPEPSARDTSVANTGVGHGLGVAQAAATPAAVRGTLRLLAAPADVHGVRHPLRISNGRMNPLPAQARSMGEPRSARRLAVANAGEAL